MRQREWLAVGAAAAMLAAALTLAPRARALEQDHWTTVWYVRFTYEHGPMSCSPLGCASDWQTLNVSVYDAAADNPDCARDDAYLHRECAVARREDIVAHGYALPSLLPGDPLAMGENRIGPGQIKYPSVKRMLCRLDLPPQDRPPCQFPDGDGPAAGAQ